jgi:signal transduction histidine kinase
MLTRLYKRNKLLMAFLTLYLVTIVMILVEIDISWYQVAKKQYIMERMPGYIFEGITLDSGEVNIDEGLSNKVNKWLNNELSGNSQYSVNADQDAKNMMWEIRNGHNRIYRISIRGKKAPSTGPETARYKFDTGEVDLGQFHDFNNSLFIRSFSGMMTMPAGNNHYRLNIYYTTPSDDPMITELTRSYLWRSLFIILILSLIALGIAWTVILPLRNVMICLEESSNERTLFNRKPGTHLEYLYDRMALDAVIARLHGTLRDEIARRPQMTGWEVVCFICESFCAQVGAPLISCIELIAEGPGRIRATGQHFIAGRDELREHGDEIAHTLDQAIPKDNNQQVQFDLPGWQLTGISRQLNDPARTGVRYLICMALDENVSGQTTEPLGDRLDRLTELIDAGIQTLSLRNQLLVQERGRANISLSRNLGHDLTNIIATSKLELLALDRILGKTGQMPEDDRKRGILSESLKGLLQSVRFMQETVNLYRSYAFLQHPVLEVQDCNQLIRETCQLFSMSMSSKINLHQELEEDVPRCMIDPRLIKLALFNMFSNSLEAIRKADPEHVARGWIKVKTRRTTGGGSCIALEDSGTGILDSRGGRAEIQEIEKIFELGYTSCRITGSQGEGLGLNWVRTIIQDLHGGTISAENITDAGARFILVFPPLERAPDLENTEVKAAEYVRKLEAINKQENG